MEKKVPGHVNLARLYFASSGQMVIRLVQRTWTLLLICLLTAYPLNFDCAEERERRRESDTVLVHDSFTYMTPSMTPSQEL